MTVFNFKKRFIISLVLLTLSLSLFVLASWAWFTKAFIDEQDYTMGYVDVDIYPYFFSPNVNDYCIFYANEISNYNDEVVFSKLGEVGYLDSQENEYTIDSSGNLVSSLQIIISSNYLLGSLNQMDYIVYIDSNNRLVNRKNEILFTYLDLFYYDSFGNKYEISSGNLVDYDTKEILINQSDIYGNQALFLDSIDQYFYLNGKSNCIEAKEFEIGSNTYKHGVYKIVIDTRNSDYFFENFRLDLVVKSSVLTYVRLKVIEQLTLEYTNANNNKVELSILTEEDMPFDYNLSLIDDNRDNDDYLYINTPHKSINEYNPNYVSIIDKYTLNPFPVYDLNFSLQIAFIVEAVQAYLGPQKEWGLETPPWEGTW